MDLIIEDMMAKLQKSETFGGRLTEAREEVERWDGKGIGYNQGELADLLADGFGVTIGRSYISELERSWQQNKMPSMEVGRALAQALKVNFAWLALLSDEKDLPDASRDTAWSPTTTAVMNVIDRWPEGARLVALDLVRALTAHVDAYAQGDEVPPPDTADGADSIREQERLNKLLTNNGSAQHGDNQPKAQPKRKSRG